MELFERFGSLHIYKISSKSSSPLSNDISSGLFNHFLSVHKKHVGFFFVSTMGKSIGETSSLCDYFRVDDDDRENGYEIVYANLSSVDDDRRNPNENDACDLVI